jgi:hypothetical protein
LITQVKKKKLILRKGSELFFIQLLEVDTGQA